MKQLFTCPLDNLKEQTIEDAKRLIYSVALEYGFPYCGEPQIKLSKDGKNYIDWEYYTNSEEAFEKMAGM